MKGIYIDYSYPAKFFIFLGMILGGFGISIILGILLANPFFGVDLLNNPSALSNFSNPENIGLLKFMQLLNSLGIFLLPPILFAYMASNNWLKYLQLDTVPGSLYAVFAFLLMFVSLPCLNFIIELNESMTLPNLLQPLEDWMRSKEEGAKELTEVFLKMETPLDYVFNVVLIGLVPAIGEELLFRGMIQRQIAKKYSNVHVGIWVSAILFSAIHMQFYGFLPRMLLGALFGYIFVWSGSLWIPILAHFINNAGAVTVQYIFGEEFTEENIDSLGAQSDDWMYLILSAALVVLILKSYYKIRIRKV